MNPPALLMYSCALISDVCAQDDRSVKMRQRSSETTVEPGCLDKVELITSITSSFHPWTPNERGQDLALLALSGLLLGF